ncbi:DUF1430 domain-containing protein [Bacillus velezensis]|uniref:DUF1430 domain-containing protein n=1 Tax=Bacillus velezensis TaxID=492670 RepID=UPI0029C67C53|nr:DUF1430 domain-containing protein [Bacillus velezensis]WPF77266.1 DUF1430 domain-containing protein [Bacillus velezensis]
MKKTIYILFILVLLSMNMSSYHYTLNKQIYYTLFSNKEALIINYTSEFKSEDFVKRLVAFSKENKVNISQYNFLDEKSLNIYSTNTENEPSIHNGNKLVSNFLRGHSEQKMIGSITFPLSTWKIRYFDFNQIKNIGIGRKFYISSNDDKVLEKAQNLFADYGEVSFENITENTAFMFNKTLLMLVLLSMLILFIGVLYFVIKNRKRLLLQKLWGYSKVKTLLSYPAMFLKPLIIIIFCGAIIVALLTFSFSLNDWLAVYLRIYFRNAVIGTLIMMVYTIMVTLVLYNNSDISGSIKGSTPIEKFQWLSVGFKIVVTILLFNIVAFSLSNLFDLKQQLDNQSYWKKTQNTYKTSFANTGIDYSDLKLDREKNVRVRALYHQLEKHKNAFVIDAHNYAVLWKDGKKPVYFYTLNTTKKNEIYSPSGRSITIGPNYLKVNPIIGANGEAISQKALRVDSNTLNLLVPQKYEKYKEKIIAAYRGQFFFDKVELDNMYNKEMNQPLNTLKKDELKINIIYTKNRQEYFTFNSEFGDAGNKNNIVDPIAAIFTDNVDPSVIGAYSTSSLFFSDSSKGMAYDRIVPYLEKTNTRDLIDSSISVYQELSDGIARIQNQFLQNLISLTITVILSIAFLVAYIWSFYSANAYRLYLKELFGYSYWARNKNLIIFSLLTNCLIGLGCSIYYKIFELTIFVGLFIVIELLILYFLSVYLNRKNMNRILKGDRI